MISRIQQCRTELLRHWIAEIFFALVLSPPCSTFSRAPWANNKGPRPVRSSKFPRGLPNLWPHERRKAQLGNVIADFTFLALERHLARRETFALLEQPEDLGAPSNPEHQDRPASMWQWPPLKKVLQLPGVDTAVFYQFHFGAEVAKPTRFLLRSNGALPSFMFSGLPKFSQSGAYLGPLQREDVPSMNLNQRNSGKFATTGTEQWPSDMCKWVARQILDSWRHHSPQHRVEIAKGEVDAGGNTVSEVDAAGNTASQDGSRGTVQRCSTSEQSNAGKPAGGDKQQAPGEDASPPSRTRLCRTVGKYKPFHDGAGLCSPGRMDLEDRKWADIGELRERLERRVSEVVGGDDKIHLEAFHMAVRGEAGCRLVTNQGLLNDLRVIMKTWLREKGDQDEEILRVAPGQPFFLRLMSALLDKVGDPDGRFLLQGETGFPAGILLPLPRTPEVFEEQTSWKLDQDLVEGAIQWASNYESVDQHEEYVRNFFDQEVAEGLMEKVELSVLRETYGDNIAIAALAVLVEDAHGGKKRIIHDGSNVVRVNHRIRCQDKIRSPGPREKMYLLDYYKRCSECLFSLVGDISKAHRRFLYDKREWGMLACMVNKEDTFVYINKVGTFGIGSASYWWSRISGAGLRLTFQLLGPNNPLEMLLFADDLEALGPGVKGRKAVVLAYLYLAALGFPFKWSKQRGGLQVEWIGLFTDYRHYRLGLSERRANWLADWTKAVADSGVVASRTFQQGLGRLGFAATALYWQRPFLGPLYTWAAATRGRPGKLKVPLMLRCILSWISEKLMNGGSLQEPIPRKAGAVEDLCFYTDAKATETEAWIGGFLQVENGGKGPWFSEQVGEDWAPWAFSKKDPKRTIAALELLATLIAIRLWIPERQTNFKGTCRAHGMTDNQSNTYAVSRRMSTKFPSTLLLMEMSEELEGKKCELDLEWVRRDDNQDADALTNQEYGAFDANLRVRVDGPGLQWRVLHKVLKSSDLFWQEVCSLKGKKTHASKKASKRGDKLPVW